MGSLAVMMPPTQQHTLIYHTRLLFSSMATCSWFYCPRLNLFLFWQNWYPKIFPSLQCFCIYLYFQQLG
ncbi:hypothetical protein RchiOBHm_Chr4g0421501 [Rosa chinensis]|uniref:Uncharacterized protein n=1 Tax=Rosa chinensis TaxID=74649 RepID=A0A2P6QY42_ROSCH|nr:hypothetical protein RchiOBHm_Chr4g0421501 [Rosa chinensis]